MVLLTFIILNISVVYRASLYVLLLGNSLEMYALWPLTLAPPNYLIGKLCFADAIHNFKLVKIIQIGQNESQRFWNLADWCHALA